MISLKKVYKDELLQLALILSLLRSHPDVNYENDLFNTVSNLDLDNGTSWRSMGGTLIRNHYVHPKSFDHSLMNYEAEVFADLNSLGRYNSEGNIQHNRNITAYLLDHIRGEGDALPEQSGQNVQVAEVANAEESLDADSPLHNLEGDVQLSQEDMDLIKVLWMQDVDLGVALNVPAVADKSGKEAANASLLGQCASTDGGNGDGDDDDRTEKLRTLEELNAGRIKIEQQDDVDDELGARPPSDPWAGLPYTIDTETGEYVIKSELDDSLDGADLPFPFPEFIDHLLLDDESDSAIDGATTKEELELLVKLSAEAEAAAAAATAADDGIYDEEEACATSYAGAGGSWDQPHDETMQTSQFHHPHHRAFQARMPFVRTMSVEQRWQDLANMLSLPGAPEGGPVHQHPFSHHHHHHHHHLHNFGHPHGHHAHGMAAYGADRGVLLHNATLNPPVGDLNATAAAPASYAPLGAAANMGSAVATSMSLGGGGGGGGGEPMPDAGAGGLYKAEPSGHEMYYSNVGGGGEFNQTDGFIASFLNDEDLLMDMALNEGMYTMRMLDGNSTGNATMGTTMSAPPAPAATATTTTTTTPERTDASSDSAVSSMGSERVPSISDGEWCDGGSDSGHTPADHYADYRADHRADHRSKYRPYDYSYAGGRQQHVPATAQKKHQMFGKRCFQEQHAPHAPHAPAVKYEYANDCAANASVYAPPVPMPEPVGGKHGDAKYSCSLEFGRQHYLQRAHLDDVQHNHTYHHHLPPENAGAMQRPFSRDKPTTITTTTTTTTATTKAKRSEEEHLTRDQKRARALSVPITVDDIINLPMDEFNERLSKYDLSEAQLSLIRDIRRRGKNKVAAQNCRKRKLDQILNLADEVKEMRDRKFRLVSDHDFLTAESQRIKDKYQQLYRHVFQNLRDPDGNHYSPYQYSLQTSADGSILIVPRANGGGGGGGGNNNNSECKEQRQQQRPGHKD